MTVLLTDSQRFSNVIKYELAPEMAICREKVTAREGSATTYTPGLVMGKTLTGGTGTAAAVAGNTGNGTMGTVTVGGTAKVGVYTVRIQQAVTNTGAFSVYFPDGTSAGSGQVGSAFSGGGLSFTLADGATDFVVGDSFTITVAGTEKWKAYDPTATDGSQFAAGIYIADDLGISHTASISANTDTKVLVINRGPVKVSDGALLWGANVTTDAQKTTAKLQLDALNIRVSTQI